MKNVVAIGRNFVSGRLAMMLVVVAFAFSAYAQDYTRPCPKLNGVGGSSNTCAVTSPTCTGVITKVEFSSTRTVATPTIPVNVTVWIRHEGSGRTGNFPWAATISTTVFNDLPCDTRWTIWFTYTPTNAIVTLDNGTLKVWKK